MHRIRQTVLCMVPCRTGLASSATVQEVQGSPREYVWVGLGACMQGSSPGGMGVAWRQRVRGGGSAPPSTFAVQNSVPTWVQVGLPGELRTPLRLAIAHANTDQPRGSPGPTLELCNDTCVVPRVPLVVPPLAASCFTSEACRQWHPLAPEVDMHLSNIPDVAEDARSTRTVLQGMGLHRQQPKTRQAADRDLEGGWRSSYQSSQELRINQTLAFQGPAPEGAVHRQDSLVDRKRRVVGHQLMA